MNRKPDRHELTEEERHLLTLEALASVDAGRVVEHADVRAWAKSLETANPLPVPRPKA
jgi:predicted transcriptional regulator